MALNRHTRMLLESMSDKSSPKQELRGNHDTDYLGIKTPLLWATPA